MSYWGYRIDVNHRDYFYKEMLEGRLRQGWGYDSSQNLMLGDKMDGTAKRNVPIFNKVKAGDILLIPRIGSWDDIAIVRAIKDFNVGYKFKIDDELHDYGHIFPVCFIKLFSRHNIKVGGDIRETFKSRRRFWNINRCKEQIDELIATPEELTSHSVYEECFREVVKAAFNEEKFANDIYVKLNKSTQASEWEHILCEGFKKICPESYDIETTSNRTEKEHGADIIIKIPGILDKYYVIAIQIKDYNGIVDRGCIEQIGKADSFFSKEEDLTLIDKYIVITKAREEINKELIEAAKEAGVNILFDKEVKKLLSQMAKAFIGDRI